MTLLTGCASPGAPRPPSLNLPKVVVNLSAVRVGDAVTLRWTTSHDTTDKLTIKGAITAEVCRQPVPGASPGIPGASAAAGKAAACAVAERVIVAPGSSEVVDRLAQDLASGDHALLEYRILLRNGAGRTAGVSAAAYAVSGTGPRAIERLRVTASKAGATLEWKAEGGPQDVVEVERSTVVAAQKTRSTAGGKTLADEAGGSKRDSRSAKAGQPDGVAKKEEVLRFQAGEGGDVGGAVDRTAETGATYRYTAERVRVVTMGARRLEMRSAVTAPVTVEMRDVFAPAAPAGLEVSPGLRAAAPGGGAGVAGVSIDLVWEPGLEARILGYRIYRSELDGGGRGEPRRLTDELVPVPAYRDMTVVEGRRYAYRVTAVDDAGHESAMSDEVTETAPAR